MSQNQERRLTAVVRGVRPLHSGFLRVNHYELEVERHEGGTRVTKWEVMERGNAVAVLGYDPTRDEVVLANELRPGMLAAGEYPFSDNLVAGAIEPNEDALEQLYLRQLGRTKLNAARFEIVDRRKRALLCCVAYREL